MPTDKDILAGATTLDASLMGLDMTQDMVTRVVAAIRGTYPSLTQDEPNDVLAFLHVLRYWVTSTLADWESKNSVPPIDVMITQVRDDHAAQMETARTKAVTDAADQIKIKDPAP